MSVGIFRVCRGHFLGGCAIVALLSFGGTAAAQQTKLPEVVVTAPKEKPKPRRVQVRTAPATAPAAPAAPVTPAAQLNAKADAFDQARSNLYTTIGTTADVISHATINALPGGDNRRSRKSCCRPRVSRRIPPPAASFTCATTMPTCSFASTA